LSSTAAYNCRIASALPCDLRYAVEQERDVHKDAAALLGWFQSIQASQKEG
jgi:hypothetical protein